MIWTLSVTVATCHISKHAAIRKKNNLMHSWILIQQLKGEQHNNSECLSSFVHCQSTVTDQSHMWHILCTEGHHHQRCNYHHCHPFVKLCLSPAYGTESRQTLQLFLGDCDSTPSLHKLCTNPAQTPASNTARFSLVYHITGTEGM